MFTLSQIKEKTFKTGIGYDKKDVEQFVNELSSDYEALQLENDDIKKKLKDLTDSISYYKSIEKTLQKALILAEKTAQDTKATAYKEAEVIEANAKANAKLIMACSQGQIEQVEHKILNLMQQYDLFKIHFKNLLNAQNELLNSTSFSLTTDHFSYQEELQKQLNSDLDSQRRDANSLSGNIESGSADQEELDQKDSDTLGPDQIIFDFLRETPARQNYQTVDGFEFIT